MRIAFTLDGCDREAIAWVATTGGITGSEIRDLMIESIERRFGPVNRLSVPIEWLSDNGSPDIAQDAGVCRRNRLGATNNADWKSAVKRHGRSLGQNHQAPLRARCHTP